MNINHLILGSSSPYRAELLRKMGLMSFTQLPSPPGEHVIDSDEVATLAEKRAIHKGLRLKAPEASVIIAADQVLEFQGKAFGKADTAGEALQRLMLFNGKAHKLHSAFCLVICDTNGKNKLYTSSTVTANMEMKTLTLCELKNYVATGEWRGCAGCYQFENQGSQLFASVDKDDSVIVGLPVLQLTCKLRELGISGLNTSNPWVLNDTAELD